MKSNNKFFDTFNCLIGYLFALLALFPIIWMAIAGFKGKTEVLSTPFRFFPKEWLVSNYITIFTDPTFFRALYITFIGAIVFAVLLLIVSSMAAFVFARLDFPFKLALWIYVIFTMMIPSIAILVPSFIVVTKLHMIDTIAVLILPGVASAGGMFFIRQFYLNVPLALEEAAMIDGCSRFRTYLYIFLPMSFAPFVLVGINAFLGYWNSYIWPIMTISNPNLFQIQQFLGNFRSERSSELGLLMAGGTLAAIPIILLFLIFQRFIIQGIKISGIK